MKSFIVSALMGLGGFGLVNLISAFTFISIPVNPVSVGISAVLGLPGVIAILGLNIFL